MTAVERGGSHASLMDGVYRRQRHVYDLTRKYYLLGRDRMLAGLAVPAGGSVLEIGCGTGRNIVLASRLYPDAGFFGLDISAEMLRSAAASMDREGVAGRVRLARGDATDFDARALFGRGQFDRVFISYALSMIPGWQRTVVRAIACLAPGGSLHVVDFGSQEHLPGWFKSALRAWLAKFHVTPRDDLFSELTAAAATAGMDVEVTPLYRGYSVHAVARLPVSG